MSPQKKLKDQVRAPEEVDLSLYMINNSHVQDRIGFLLN